MRDWPYFWHIVVVGSLALVAESLFLFRVIRGRAGAGTCPSIRTVVFAVVVALAVPSLVVVLASAGQSGLIKDTVGPAAYRWDAMSREWNQQRVLLLGTSLGLPPLLLAGMMAGAAVSRRRGRAWRILFSAAAPAILVPFFCGIWLYLYRLLTIEYPGLTGYTARQRAPFVASTLSAAKHALDVGALAAGIVLAVILALVFFQIVRTRNERTPVGAPPKRTVLHATVVTAMAGIVWWLSGALAAENHTPIPDIANRITERVFPAIQEDVSQDELYDLSAQARMGTYRNRLPFPLVARVEDALVLWGPVIVLEGTGVSIDYMHVGTRRELYDEFLRTREVMRVLHGNNAVGSPLIKAQPNLPLDLLADVLAMVYDDGGREVRFVTGLPETIQRPSLGRLSRIAFQTTTVAIACSGDLDPKEQQRSILVPGGFARYRDLLDHVLGAPPASLPPVLVLGREVPWHWNGWKSQPSSQTESQEHHHGAGQEHGDGR